MYGIDSFLGYIDSFIWFPSKQEIVRNNYFPSDSILSEIFLTWLLWKGIYICKIKILSEMIKVGNDSFRQTQFGPKASETISQRRWRGRHFSASGLNNFWRFFGGFVFATQRRFSPKLKVCPSFVSSTNPLAQNSKLENNASDNKIFRPWIFWLWTPN